MRAACSLSRAGKSKKKKSKKKKKKRATLSFAEDLDAAGGGGGEAPAGVVARPKKKVRKDPTVKTDFLPDRERELAELALKEKLKQEWFEKQEEEKSAWRGVAPRRTVPGSRALVRVRGTLQRRSWKSHTVTGMDQAIEGRSRYARGT